MTTTTTIISTTTTIISTTTKTMAVSPSLLSPYRYSGHLKFNSPKNRRVPIFISITATGGRALSLFSRSGSAFESIDRNRHLRSGRKQQLSLLSGGPSRLICSCKLADDEDGTTDWPVLERWDVPWPWQTVLLTSLACVLSFVLTGLVEAAAIPVLGLEINNLSLDEKAELLFVDQAITTAAVLGILFSITKSFQPLPDDILRYDFREPFDLEKGWLLWTVIGLAGALGSIALLGLAMSYSSGENPQRETDALVLLLPLIGSSSVSTVCLVGATGVLAPVLEETVFRGFLMASLTKWLPTPLSITISAAVFSLAHLTPGEFPQLFFLGTVFGLLYAQTRNLLTPIMVHSLWNSGVILLVTFLQLQGYDIKELLQASQ